MRHLTSLTRKLLGRSSFDREVQEELQFHIEQRAEGYERKGISAAESRVLAVERFGDFELIKKECVQIAERNSTGVFAMKMMFILTFLTGVLIRALGLDYRVSRIGDVLMMIAVLGGLLLYGKKFGALRNASKTEPIKLGLGNSESSIPRSFDDQGRTPFDRVRVD